MPWDRQSVRNHIRTASLADPVGDLRKEWHAQRMRIEEWWPKLDPATQEWLIANNGDVVRPTVLGEIAAAGGDVTSDSSSNGDNGPGGFLLSDATALPTGSLRRFRVDLPAGLGFLTRRGCRWFVRWRA